MKKTFIFAALLLAVATTITIVSCKKDKETVKNNISENSIKSYELSEMDKTMIAFGEKLKSASNERSGETMPLEEALNTLTNYQNFSMCDASHFSIEMLTDTIHATLNVTNGEVLLSELNRFYETTRREILPDGIRQKFLYCIQSVADNNTNADLNSISGNLDVSVIVRIPDLTLTRDYDYVFDDTLSWYDFEGLGICNPGNEGLYSGWDCVRVINARLHNIVVLTLCGPGYHTYYTNITSLRLHAYQFPDSSSPNGYSAIPWRSFWDNAQCVSPTEMTYYMNSFEDIFDELEDFYLQPIIDFNIIENQFYRDENHNWEAFTTVRLGDINCTPILPND